jgi:hypothetical protein
MQYSIYQEKEYFVYLSLSLSLNSLWFTKKSTPPPSAKMVPVVSRYGKIYTFESIWWLYLLSLRSPTVNPHYSWPNSFTCYNNENVFMKGTSMKLSGGINAVLAKVRNNEQGCRIFHYKHICSLLKVRNKSSLCWVLYFLNDVTLIPFVVKNVVHVMISYLFIYFIYFKIHNKCIFIHLSLYLKDNVLPEKNQQ